MVALFSVVLAYLSCAVKKTNRKEKKKVWVKFALVNNVYRLHDVCINCNIVRFAHLCLKWYTVWRAVGEIVGGIVLRATIAGL